MVPNIGLTMYMESRWGPIIKIQRPKSKTDRAMTLRDSTPLVEGAKLYNAVPQDIREYNGSYNGFKNLVDKWLAWIPDVPRILGDEPEARDIDGVPSNSIRDWTRLSENYWCIDDNDFEGLEVFEEMDTV